MAPEHRTRTTLPTHAMYTADIDGEALWLWLRNNNNNNKNQEAERVIFLERL